MYNFVCRRQDELLKRVCPALRLRHITMVPERTREDCDARRASKWAGSKGSSVNARYGWRRGVLVTLGVGSWREARGMWRHLIIMMRATAAILASVFVVVGVTVSMVARTATETLS